MLFSGSPSSPLTTAIRICLLSTRTSHLHLLHVGVEVEPSQKFLPPGSVTLPLRVSRWYTSWSSSYSWLPNHYSALITHENPSLAKFHSSSYLKNLPGYSPSQNRKFRHTNHFLLSTTFHPPKDLPYSFNHQQCTTITPKTKFYKFYN